MFSLLMFSLMALKLFGERCENVVVVVVVPEYGGMNGCDSSYTEWIWQLQMISTKYEVLIPVVAGVRYGLCA